MGRKPDFIVKSPITESDGSTRWFKVGVAWVNAADDAAAVSIELNALPLGKLCLFKPDKEK